jgi:hypothetical protein
MKFSLDRDGAVVHDNNGELRVRWSGGAWRLELKNSSVTSSSAIAPAVNRTDLLVVRLTFTSGTDTAELWVNPVPGSAAPGTPQATASTTGDLRFSEVNLYPGSNNGDGLFDEIRLGATWASVLPVPSLPAAPVVFSPLPGRFQQPVNVALTSPTSGATIHYTLDGSTPTTASPVYSAPLAVGATTVVRALAVKSGSTPSAVSGGNFRIDGFAAWLGEAGLPVATAPDADPDGSGVSLLVRYALGLPARGNPAVGQPGGTAGLPLIQSSATAASLEFIAREDPRLVVEAESSPDLVAWTRVALSIRSIGSHSDAGHDITVGAASAGWRTYRVTAPGGLPRFLRVRVTLAE